MQQESELQDTAVTLSVGPWLCFHCDELLTTRKAAAEHFGDGEYERETPLCIEAATTEQRQLVLTNREIWKELMESRRENEDLEERLNAFEYIARKLTKKPTAYSSDLEHEWDSMEGRVIALEARVKELESR